MSTNQELTSGERQQLIALANRNRSEAARLQKIADQKFDTAARGNNKIARANNGEWERNQALKLITAALEFERRAAEPAAQPPKPAAPSTIPKKAATPPQPKPEIKPPTNQEVEFRAESNIDERNFRTRRSAGNSFDISQFRENVVNNVLPTHSFLVVFSPMRWVDTKAARDGIERDLTMRCENAILPQLGLLQQDNLRRYGYGPIENVPYGYNMGDFTLQFIVDKDARIVNFFESWTNFIVNRDSYGGATMTKLGQVPKPYEVAFKDDYVCPSVNVFVYDRSQNLIFEYNIYDVYPNNIQSMNLSWGDENQLMRLNVGFSFTDMRIRTAYDPQSYGPDRLPTVEVADPGALGRNVTDLGILAIDPTTNFSSVGVADNLNQPISIGDVNVPEIPAGATVETFSSTTTETYTETTITSVSNLE